MDFNYFNYFNKSVIIKKDYISLRKHRQKVNGFLKAYTFSVGDIIEVIFFLKNIPLIFTGICISLKKKKLKVPDVSFILRNVIMQIGIEFNFSFYYNRLYKMKFLDYKRKFHTYKKNRLFFIRNNINRQSKVF